MFGCPSVVLQQTCDRASAEVLPQDSGAFYVAGEAGWSLRGHWRLDAESRGGCSLEVAGSYSGAVGGGKAVESQGRSIPSAQLQYPARD